MSHDQSNVLEHHHTLTEELLCHFPFAIGSVALSIIALSFMGLGAMDHHVMHTLFHSFHYLHLLFAGTGAVLVYRKYSSSILGALLVGIFVPVVFCTLSDSLLPFVGGYYLGLDMHFHWCFWSHLGSVLPFLFVGIINGFVMSGHSSSQQLFYSQGSHFFHILISAMASMLYFVGFGFSDWQHSLGFVFVFMLFAVLIPCTLSDVVVPMFFAKHSAKHDLAHPSCEVPGAGKGESREKHKTD